MGEVLHTSGRPATELSRSSGGRSIVNTPYFDRRPMCDYVRRTSRVGRSLGHCADPSDTMRSVRSDQLFLLFELRRGRSLPARALRVEKLLGDSLVPLAT